MPTDRRPAVSDTPAGADEATVLAPQFARALHAHQAGALDVAEACYRSIIAVEPAHAHAQHNLGALRLQRGDTAGGLPHFRAALQTQPSRLQFWISYIDALLLGDKAGSALTVLKQGLAHGLRGAAVEPMLARVAAALPEHAEAQRLWGVGLVELGRWAQAEAALRCAVTIDPTDAPAQHHLAWVYKEMGRLAQAENCARLAAQHAPQWPDALNTLGNLLFDQGRLLQAEQCYREAIALAPDYAEAHNNLGNALGEQCQVLAALACYQQAVHINPDYQGAWSNLLYCLNYHPELSAADIFARYRDWAARFEPQECSPPQRAPGARKGSTSGRRIRVGYVSPDFCAHSCVHFLEPLLAHHDRSRFEVYAYAELHHDDAVTQRYRQSVEHWRPTRALRDEDLARQVHGDQIDVLVDLAGHTAGNRLGLFARRPAPVSVSWLGFGYTTGLRSIDYFLTDAECAPVGCENLFSERLWRVPVAWAYRPGTGMGEVGPLPNGRKGCITFGTLTRALRINADTVRVWAQILRTVGGSHLVVNSASFREVAAQDALARQFVELGVARERLEIGYHGVPSDVLRGIDIGLDCFPHNSGTTLFESLYMGVPFVTLAGRPGVGRIGSAVLAGAGLGQWIANTAAEYVQIAVALAHDVDRLAAWRARLRGLLQASPLMDEAGFAHSVESAYGQMLHADLDGPAANERSNE